VAIHVKLGLEPKCIPDSKVGIVNVTRCQKNSNEQISADLSERRVCENTASLQSKPTPPTACSIPFKPPHSARQVAALQASRLQHSRLQHSLFRGTQSAATGCYRPPQAATARHRLPNFLALPLLPWGFLGLPGVLWRSLALPGPCDALYDDCSTLSPCQGTLQDPVFLLFGPPFARVPKYSFLEKSTNGRVPKSGHLYDDFNTPHSLENRIQNGTP